MKAVKITIATGGREIVWHRFAPSLANAHVDALQAIEHEPLFTDEIIAGHRPVITNVCYEDAPAQELAARAKIALLTMYELCAAWDATEKQIISMELADVRGWLMDEFAKRDPAAYVRWIESCESSPLSYFNHA